MFLKYGCQKLVKKDCRRPVIYEELQFARKVSLHFNKFPNSLRQVLQTDSEICTFCVLQKNVLQKQLAKIDLKVPAKSCDDIDDDIGRKFDIQ